MMNIQGCFFGSTSVDMMYLVQSPVTENKKYISDDFEICPGGPATNASLAFQKLGGEATLITSIGKHPISKIVKEMIQDKEIFHVDLTPKNSQKISIASIIVKEDGQRTIVAYSAQKAPIEMNPISPNLLRDHSFILFDGHRVELSEDLAKRNHENHKINIIDADMWIEGIERLFPLMDIIITSSSFDAPGCSDKNRIFDYLMGFNPKILIMTDEENEIRYYSEKENGTVLPPAIKPVNTNGAGDIFHGAFCYYYFQHPLKIAIEKSAAVASESCTQFSTGW